MANKVVSLDNIVSQGINGPKVDGIPLYTRLDGSQEVGFNSNSNKSVKWEKESLFTYNSPTNIRRVFITGRKIVVQTYKPAIIKGKPSSGGCWRSFTLDGDNNLYEAVYNSVNYKTNLSKYYMDMKLNRDAKEPDKITIKGTGLKALSSPWVISNVEEVYFDWTLLASESYRNAAMGCDELLQAYIQNKRGYMSSNIALDMFVLANSCNVKDISNRFPRLRCVGLISELGKILETDYDKGKTNIDSVDDSIKLWSQLGKNVSLIKQSNSLVVLNKIDTRVGKYNTKFSLRDGIYRYDDEVLRDFFADYTSRAEKLLKQRDTDKVEVEDNTDVTEVKSELEILLDNISSNKSLGDAKSVLILALSGAKLSEVNAIFDEMSTDGKKKYRGMI